MLWYSLVAGSLALAVLYSLLLRWYTRHWNAMPIWEIPGDYTPSVRITVVIAARNEAANIGACLHSVLAQDYPAHLYEVIVVDDDSTDDTASQVENISDPRLRLIRLAENDPDPALFAFKKKAIETGIARATGGLIAVTDADCIVAPGWLMLLASLYERRNAVLIAAPVLFHKESNLLERFQSLDMMGMMAVTGAGLHTRSMRMCNGANLAYDKGCFLAAGGFRGLDGIASGDDMLLAQKLAKANADRIFFLKNPGAAVYTEAKPDWASFFQQRLRWASKSAHYIEWRVTAALGLVFLLCMSMFFNLILSLWMPMLLPVLVFQLALKIMADHAFLQNISRWFGKSELMRDFLPAFFLHCWYIISAGAASTIIRKYEWKGRRVR